MAIIIVVIPYRIRIRNNSAEIIPTTVRVQKMAVLTGADDPIVDVLVTTSICRKVSSLTP